MSGYHDTRFTPDARRETLWKTLVTAYFQRLIPVGGCTLELGAGYAHFINNVRSLQRIAVDTWKGLRDHAAPGVQTLIQTACDLSGIEAASVDFAFASNLTEHLTKEEFSGLLQQLRQKLKPGGTLNLLQPNYRFAFREYFDDYTVQDFGMPAAVPAAHRQVPRAGFPTADPTLLAFAMEDTGQTDAGALYSRLGIADSTHRGR
jgi:SAM-dependent methyltransferase